MDIPHFFFSLNHLLSKITNPFQFWKPLHDNFIINDVFLYVIKLSFIHWSLIQLRNRFFTIFIAENAFSTVAIAIGKINAKLTNK